MKILHQSKHFKPLLLGFLLVLAAALLWLTPIRCYLNPEVLRDTTDSAGPGGPMVFMGLSILSFCLFVPGSILIALAGGLYGAFWGFVYLWPSALAVATVVFLISRCLGREFAASLVGDRWRRYDELIEANGFTLVLYLRLLSVPFAPLSFMMGLTRIRFWDYFLATALGLTVSMLALIYFAGTVRAVWLSGDWSQLASARVALSLALVVATILIPRLTKNRRCSTLALPSGGRPPKNGVCPRSARRGMKTLLGPEGPQNWIDGGL